MPPHARFYLTRHRLQGRSRTCSHDLAITLREIARQAADGFFYKCNVGAVAIAGRPASGSRFPPRAFLPGPLQEAARDFACCDCDYRGFHIVVRSSP